MRETENDKGHYKYTFFERKPRKTSDFVAAIGLSYDRLIFHKVLYFKKV
jgi:hypothetical protein